MKRYLIAGLFVTLITHISLANADIFAVSGTGTVYESGGTVIALTPITGEYDTDTESITLDPWMFFGLAVNSQIDVLPPGMHSFPGVLPINVHTGQLGGHVTTDWGVSTFPSGIVWDVTSHPGGQHFEPIDSDGDGIPGQIFITGPFPGFTLVYEFDAGIPGPSIDVSINVEGGTYQQCDEVGGKYVELAATVDLGGGAVLDSIEWTVDGNSAGLGGSIMPFLSLGAHSISATATGVSGIYDTASSSVSIVDTVRPDLSIEFIDTRTGQVVTSVEGARTSFIGVRLSGMDACDADVDISGVAKPAYAILAGEVIKIQGNNRDVDMPTTAIEVTATATDDSGNQQLGQAILPINN